MSNPIFDDIREAVKQTQHKQREQESKTKLQNEFAAFDFSKLRKMKDPELAAWQSKYPLDSPQYIIASQEWINRSLSKQLKWVKFSAIIGPITTLIAAILGVWAGAYWQENLQQKQQPPAIEQSLKTPSVPNSFHKPESEKIQKIEPDQTRNNKGSRTTEQPTALDPE